MTAFEEDCLENRSYVVSAFETALDDDYPDVMDRCVVEVMDELNTDDADYAEKVVKAIMGW